MGKEELWGWFLALTAGPAIFFLLTYTMTGKIDLNSIKSKIFLSAESPRYTIIEKNNDSEGRRVLEKLRGTSNVSGRLCILP